MFIGYIFVGGYGFSRVSRVYREEENGFGFDLSDTDLRTDLVDKSLKYYWCRLRVKGTKRLRQSELCEETAEATGSGDFGLTTDKAPVVTPANLGLQTAAEVEAPKTEAIVGPVWVRDVHEAHTLLL